MPICKLFSRALMGPILKMTLLTRLQEEANSSIIRHTYVIAVVEPIVARTNTAQEICDIYAALNPRDTCKFGKA